jgi:ABC-type Fe3+/spermidine/putrescine transport system ATPase subunit
MNEGRLIQEGSPRDIYAAPATAFVAEFIGGSNILPGRVVGRNGGKARIALQANGELIDIDTQAAPGDAVKVLLRPESVSLSAAPLEGANVLSGRVTASSFTGSAVDYDIEIAGGTQLRVIAPSDVRFDRGTAVWLVVRDARGLPGDRQQP